MRKESPITEETGNLQSRYLTAHAVAMVMTIAAALLILSGCERKPVMAHAHFKHLPANGWQRIMPLTFTPEYDDSTATYDLALAVRHENTYRYRNLSLIVDVIATDSTVSRHSLDIALADEYGNWSGGGFGTLYQDEVSVVTGILPDEARSLVVWQAMEGCDTLSGLVNVGIIVNPQ